MMTSLSALDIHSDTASDTTSGRSSSSSSAKSDGVAGRRVRDALRLLRCLDHVEFSGTTLNWDAKTCFVVLVFMRDTDARRQAFAQGETRHLPPPFQIERTKTELSKLLKAMRHWCGKPHESAGEKRCAFCAPITSGGLVAEALRVAKDDSDDVYEYLGEDEHDGGAPISSCCFGFLSSPLGSHATLKPESEDEWEAWLNATIVHVRGGVDIHAGDADLCDGARHVPGLLARFLLESFLPDAIP